MLIDKLNGVSDFTFNDIVETVSADQIKTTHFLQTFPILQSESKNDPLHQVELAQKIKEMRDYIDSLSSDQKAAAQSEDTLVNIAYFARIIAMAHPGWDHFDTNPFQRAVEDLYREQKQLRQTEQVKGRKLLEEFFRITATTIPDNHLTVKTRDGQFPLEKGIKKTLESWKDPKIRHDKGTVGQNMAFRLTEVGDILALEYLAGDQKRPTLVAERTIGGEKTGIIAFPNSTVCWGGKTQMQEIKALRRIVDTFKKYQSSWKNVIIDVRNNGGGDGFPIREIAETLYGNKVPYCLNTQKRNTVESQMRLLFSGKEEDYIGPALSFKGEKKGLYILVDKEVASAAESIVPMLKHYPGVSFIGENTCGCCQYGAIRPIALPNGGQVNVGSVFRSYEDGMVECIGHAPDINCSGRDAFRETINLIGNRGIRSMSAYRDNTK